MNIEKGLLLHWWHYYGKAIYTLEELEKFEEIIDEYGIDKVLDLAVASYICYDGSPTVILQGIRNNVVERLFDTLPKFENMDEKQKEDYNEIKKEFVEIISKTYNQ